MRYDSYCAPLVRDTKVPPRSYTVSFLLIMENLSGRHLIRHMFDKSLQKEVLRNWVSQTRTHVACLHHGYSKPKRSVWSPRMCGQYPAWSRKAIIDNGLPVHSVTTWRSASAHACSMCHLPTKFSSQLSRDAAQPQAWTNNPAVSSSDFPLRYPFPFLQCFPQSNSGLESQTHQWSSATTAIIKRSMPKPNPTSTILLFNLCSTSRLHSPEIEMGPFQPGNRSKWTLLSFFLNNPSEAHFTHMRLISVQNVVVAVDGDTRNIPAHKIPFSEGTFSTSILHHQKEVIKLDKSIKTTITISPLRRNQY